MTTHKYIQRCPTLRRHARSATVILATAGFVCSSAYAKTEGEALLASSPMPHERLGDGKDSTKVHWVRLQGYFEGANGHVAMMDDLKAQVKTCMQTAQQAGRRTRPPQVWPDYVSSLQRDTYDSANRSISYATTLLYTVNHEDCSLQENRRAVATLASTQGICEIDFVTRKAHGFCDARAHSTASPLARTGSPAPSRPPAGAPAPSRAALAALEKAIALAPGKTGERKTILGIECQVWKSPFDPKGSACLSLGGSFVASHATFGLSGSSMELEMVSTLGGNLHAVKAKLDAQVNSAVFAPYLTAGFEVSNVGGR